MSEVVGYIASVIVALSLLMRNVYKLRIFNFIGAVLFVIYGIMINATAVWLVNLFVAVVDLYYLYELKSKTELFKFIRLDYGELVESFINKNISDIVNYFPHIKDIDLKNLSYFLVIRNFVIVGIFGYRRIDDKTLSIEIDYILSDWRDFKNAISFIKYLSKNDEFKNKKFCTFTENPDHIKYLKIIGFKEQEKGKFVFEL